MPTRRALLGQITCSALYSALAYSGAAEAQESLGGFRGSLDATHEGLRPGALDDQSAAFADALAKAARNGQALFLPPGRYELARIELPSHAHILGMPGQSEIAFRGGPFLLSAKLADTVRLEGVRIDGGQLPLEAAGLLDADSVAALVIEDCEFLASGGAGLALRNCAGRFARSKIEAVATVGLAISEARGMSVVDNTISECGDTGILVARDVEDNDDTIIRGNRVSAIAARSGGTGQYGNGINLAKANGVIVSDNRVDDCAFSAIRCFSSDNVQVTGNTATRCGETAIYVEFAFEGAIVSDNLIDDAVNGISLPNFMEHGGRLAVCSGNLVRNVRGGPRYADGNPQIGAGIAAEADAAITGNVIENARQGMQLGWGPYLRDVAATGNVIRGCPIGVGVSVVEGVGPALIANNLITGAETGAILGLRWEEIASEDLALADAQTFPQLTVAGNRVS